MYLLSLSQRSFQEFDGFYQLLLSSSGRGATSLAPPCSAIWKSGKGRARQALTFSSAAAWLQTRLLANAHVKIFHVVLIGEVWHFHCALVFDSCLRLAWQHKDNQAWILKMVGESFDQVMGNYWKLWRRHTSDRLCSFLLIIAVKTTISVIPPCDVQSNRHKTFTWIVHVKDELGASECAATHRSS